MKWLGAGLTCVNFATVSGLLLGMATGGLSRNVAWGAICLGIAAGLLALVTTSSPPRKRNRKARLTSIEICGFGLRLPVSAIFAFRCFCWLVYVDGDELKIQSPHNLGDLALHLTYIKEFANGVALWPDNPIFLYGKMRYPAGTDLFNALTTCRA